MKPEPLAGGLTRHLGRCNRVQQVREVSAFGVIACFSFRLPSPARRGRVVLVLLPVQGKRAALAFLARGEGSQIREGGP